MSDEIKAEVRDDLDNHRYVIDVGGDVVGFAEYHLRGGRHFFVHTEIDDTHAGRGLGTSLVKAALDDVRASGGSVVPLCPLVAAFIDRHPEYQDLVDHQIMERIDRADSRGS